jgi:hypothetical protein
MAIGAIVAEIGDLLGRDSGFSANGRADVNSKRASDKRCHAEFGQAFQFVIDQMAAHLGPFHLHVRPKKSAVVRGDLNRHDDVAEPAPDARVNEFHEQTVKQAALVSGSARNACHRIPSF